jgi:DNA-dependent RNA polymerase auxiliary subunit epsilon
MQQLYAERDAYLKMRSRLLGDSKYEGKFVAVLKGRVIDADFDERQLVRRMYAKYGYVVAFVEKVQTRKKVLEVPSPELRR